MTQTRNLNSISAAQRAALAALVANPKYELIPLPSAGEHAAALPPGASVTVTVSVRLGLDATLGLAEWLSARGHDVAPHVAARMIRDRAHLADVVERMRAAAIRKVFVVGGDGPPTGELPDGLALLRALDGIGHPFEEIGVPCYPEGHSSIADDVLLRDLREKQRFAHAMTTQMSFNAGAVATWIIAIRREGVALPIDLGVPGAVELQKLLRIATRIGVVDSTRYLAKQRGLLGHLLTRRSSGPDEFLRELAPALADAASGVRALHVFTMNDVAATLAWQRQALQELT